LPVLICTASSIQDPGINLVEASIEARGSSVYRFETDLFPADLRLTIGLDRRNRFLLADGDRELDLSQVSAVWIRGMDTGLQLPDGLDPEHHEAVQSESNSMVLAMLESLNVFKLDPPENLRRAPYKPRQLQLAREAGLDIPRTLITNDPKAVHEFADACGNGLIVKMVDGSGIRLETEFGTEPVYTRRISSEEIHNLDDLRFCPMIFQEFVPKALELRITVVGTQTFVAAVDSTVSRSGAEDWRADTKLLDQFTPFNRCPQAILDRLLTMLTCLGLNFATIDMILTPDGRYVFLEFNTISGFAFIEKATGFPISAAIADLLLGLTPSRIPA